MKKSEELLSQTWVISLNRIADLRGSFVKTYAASAFAESGLSFECAEEYYSVSKRNVVRGMHFQIPPRAHAKLVYCAAGAVVDVLLDLRTGPDYGRVATTILSADSPTLLLIPAGVAHGFVSLQDESLMIYKTSTEHAPEFDKGIRWDSFGHTWGLKDPVTLSARDSSLPAFSQFTTPF